MASELTLEEAWRLAIAKERESRELYERLAVLCADSATRGLFQFLAREEDRHEQVLQDEFDRAFRPDM